MVLAARIGNQNYNIPRNDVSIITPLGTGALRHLGVVINIDTDSVAFYLDGQLVVDDSLKGTIAEGWLKELDCMQVGPENYANLFGRPPGVWGPTGLQRERRRQKPCSLLHCVCLLMLPPAMAASATPPRLVACCLCAQRQHRGVSDERCRSSFKRTSWTVVRTHTQHTNNNTHHTQPIQQTQNTQHTQHTQHTYDKQQHTAQGKPQGTHSTHARTASQAHTAHTAGQIRT